MVRKNILIGLSAGFILEDIKFLLFRFWRSLNDNFDSKFLHYVRCLLYGVSKLKELEKIHQFLEVETK